jgi:hypothetical protein
MANIFLISSNQTILEKGSCGTSDLIIDEDNSLSSSNANIMHGINYS